MAVNTLENFVGIQNEVLQFGFNDGPQVNRNRIKKWINEGQLLIARKIEAPEFQANQSITLVAETFKYSLPSRFTRIQDVVYPEVAYRLRPIDLQQFDQNAPGKILGPPTMYTQFQNELWLSPAPSTTVGGEVIEAHYIREPAKLVGDTEEPELNGNYWHLLVDYAVQRGFEAEDDYEAAQYFTGRFKADLDEYATDVQRRDVDRPRQVSGAWAGAGYGSRLMF